VSSQVPRQADVEQAGIRPIVRDEIGPVGILGCVDELTDLQHHVACLGHAPAPDQKPGFASLMMAA